MLLITRHLALLLQRQFKPVCALAIMLPGLIYFNTVVSAPIDFKKSNTNIGLAEYSLHKIPVTLNKISKNASGLTYNHNTQSLFAIINKPTLLIEITRSGKEIRSIKLEGFEDTEGIAYIGQNKFAILEERRRSIAIIKIDADTKTFRRKSAKLLTLPLTNKENKGFEGISYNPVSESLFVVNEKKPRAIYQIQGFSGDDRHINISSPWDLENEHHNNQDFSGIYFHPATEHLILLSDESAQITETSIDGTKISKLSLSTGWLESIPQAEGITMDANNNLYILSEPNLLYTLTPP